MSTLIEDADDDPLQSHILLTIGQDSSGHWLVRENHGLVGGIFVSRDAALHFAEDERSVLPGATIRFAHRPMASLLSPQQDALA